ncbi:MAG: hypothetical protein ACI9J2_000441 [Saprospiraceae bacterium]|jgi:hypothetical protein
MLIIFSALCFSGCSNDLLNNEPDQAECKRLQGVWFKHSSPSPSAMVGLCITRTSDEGKACLDASDCESVCVTQQLTQGKTIVDGHCFGWSNVAGHCINQLINGAAVGTVCSD